MSETLKLQLQFGGGAELLFDKIKKREVELPALKKYFPNCQHNKWTIRNLLVWIKDNLLRERPELFLQVLFIYFYDSHKFFLAKLVMEFLQKKIIAYIPNMKLSLA